MNGKQAKKLRRLSEYKVGTKQDLKGKAHGPRQRNTTIALNIGGQLKKVNGYIKYQAITIVNLAKQKYKIAKKTFRRLKKTYNR